VWPPFELCVRARHSGMEFVEQGSWVRPYNACWVVDFLHSLPPTRYDFPATEDFNSPAAEEYFLGTASWPVALALCTLIAMVLVCLRIVFCRTLLRRRDSTSHSEPSWIPLLLVSLLFLAVIWFGYYLFAHYVRHGLDQSQGVLDTLKDHARNAKTAADELDAVALNLYDHIKALDTACGGRFPPLNNMVEETAAAEETLTQYTDYVQELPAQLDSISFFDTLNFWALVGLDAPLVSTGVASLCIFTSFALWLATCGTLACRRFFLCLGSTWSLLAIFVIAMVTCVEFFLAIVVSDFCSNASENAVGLADHYAGNNSTAYNLTRYYLVGDTPSILNVTIQNATSDMEAFVLKFDSYKAEISVACPTWDPDGSKSKQINDDSASLKHYIQSVTNSTAPRVVYPLWVSGVYDETCNLFVPGVFWLAVVQLVVGLVLLPCQILCMHAFSRKYVTALSSARQRQVHGGPLLPDSVGGTSMRGVVR